MATGSASAMPWWAWAAPALAWAALGAAVFAGMDGALQAGAAAALVATVFASVHHAEVVAHKVGEPFGTLVLAIAVTVIEVALIVSLMVGGAENAALARDTVFATVMLVCNGIVGLCLLVGGVRHHEQGFQEQGANAALAVLAALTVLTLVLPNFTVATPGPAFSPPQLAFAGVVSLVLYAGFVFVQTVRHRDYFLAPAHDGPEAHAPAASGRATALSGALLVACLVAVVGLAKALTPSLEAAVTWSGAPKAVVGIVIAALVLMPEGLSALRAAHANRLQTSMNLALGSALASIGLTIPAVAAVSLTLGHSLALGLDGKEEVLLGLTLLVSVITLGNGRTTVLQGIVHLVILSAFLFLAAVP